MADAAPARPLRDLLEARLPELVAQTVARDPAQWTGYSLRPLLVVDSPRSPFLQGLEEAVCANLDYEIATQQPDGCWLPTWSWGEMFPAEWAGARREWAGVLTLQNLLSLERFGRLPARGPAEPGAGVRG